MNLHRHIRLSLLTLCLLFASTGQAQPTLGEYFEQIQQRVDALIIAVVKNDYTQAAMINKRLRILTQELHETNQLPVGENNSNWQYFSSNLYHHTQELDLTIQKQDGVATIYLLATIIDHIGELQATVPLWLRKHLFSLLDQLKQGLINHDARVIRDMAEELHVSSTKLLMSATTRRSAYRHIRWVGTISAINRLGDEMIPMSEKGHWEKIANNAAEIEILLSRWANSFVDNEGTE